MRMPLRNDSVAMCCCRSSRRACWIARAPTPVGADMAVVKVARVRALEGNNGVLSISIVHGFRRADIPLMGTQVIVITDNQPEHGAALAKKLGRELFEMRGRCADPVTPMEDAIGAAVAWDDATHGPLSLTTADGAGRVMP